MTDEAEENEIGFGAWMLAARPKTLLAAIVPVWAGCVLGFHLTGGWDAYLAGFTLASALCIQIATNFFNDALDHLKGADTDARIGPKRVTAEGLIPPQAVMLAAVTFLLMACTFALPLIVARGWPILAIGIPSLYFSFGYTGGPVPLAYRGLGELFVILFFGLIAVMGTVFVQIGEWRGEALLLGVQIGLFSTALIAINNLRDVVEDTQSGKRTLAVRFGIPFARAEIAVCCLGPLAAGFVWMSGFASLRLFAIPLALLPVSGLLVAKACTSRPGPVFNGYLGMAAGQMLLFAVLFTVAVLIP